jgi:biopolymer transport protein ExbD
MEFERRHHSHNFIQIAPLVDVVFLLLLFFLLTYHLGQEERIRIALPRARSAEASQAESPPTVAVTRDGDIYCMGRKTDLASLRGVVSALRPGGRVETLRIRADREVPVGLLVQVIDEARLGGARTLSIATERR